MRTRVRKFTRTDIREYILLLVILVSSYFYSRSRGPHKMNIPRARFISPVFAPTINIFSRQRPIAGVPHLIKSMTRGEGTREPFMITERSISATRRGSDRRGRDGGGGGEV